MGSEVNFCAYCAGKWNVNRPVMSVYREVGHCQVCWKAWVAQQISLDQLESTLPTALRHWKVKTGYRSKELCRRAGVSEQMMSLYMREDKPARPGLETFLRLCAAMDVTPDMVLGFEDPRIAALEAEVKKLNDVLATAVTWAERLVQSEPALKAAAALEHPC